MDNEIYKLYRKHKVEIFDIIDDVIRRAPTRDPMAFLFGYETEEDEEEFKKKTEEYLKLEEPKIREKLKELGFDSTQKNEV